MKLTKCFLMVALLAVAMVSAANASPIFTVSGSIGGAPTGGKLDNLDWLGVPGGHSAVGITVTLTGDAAAVTGGLIGAYAQPYLSGSNGTGFGNLSDGPDATVYLTSGASSSGAGAAVNLPGYMNYFGLLWGSVDTYNTLNFYDGTTLLGSITGGQVLSGAHGDQGVNGTLYVNITSDTFFNRVVATSSNYALEFDNIAFGDPPTDPVPEPTSMLLLGTGVVGLAGRAWRKRRQ